MQSDRPPPAFVLRSCNRWTGDTTDRTCEAAKRVGHGRPPKQTIAGQWLLGGVTYEKWVDG
jgi:hypothetical protein